MCLYTLTIHSLVQCILCIYIRHSTCSLNQRFYLNFFKRLVLRSNVLYAREILLTPLPFYTIIQLYTRKK